MSQHAAAAFLELCFTSVLQIATLAVTMALLGHVILHSMALNVFQNNYKFVLVYLGAV